MFTMVADAKIDEITEDSTGAIVLFNYVCPCCQNKLESAVYFNEKNLERMDGKWGFLYECDECSKRLFLNTTRNN